MLRKSFKRKPRLVEVIRPSGQRQVMSEGQYTSKTIQEKRDELDRMRMGLSTYRDPERLIQYECGRWML